MRVEELLFHHAARRPEHVAVVCGSRRLTYDELSKAVKAKARGRPGEAHRDSTA
jgi:non-ribosomal peptide synthetase component E (peptide arylation enzyme)